MPSNLFWPEGSTGSLGCNIYSKLGLKRMMFSILELFGDKEDDWTLKGHENCLFSICVFSSYIFAYQKKNLQRKTQKQKTQKQNKKPCRCIFDPCSLEVEWWRAAETPEMPPASCRPWRMRPHSSGHFTTHFYSLLLTSPHFSSLLLTSPHVSSLLLMYPHVSSCLLMVVQ